MGYNTQYTAKVPDEFLALWEPDPQMAEHIEALKGMGVKVDLEQQPIEICEGVEISIGRKGDRIFTVDGYCFEPSRRDPNTFYMSGKFYDWEEHFKRISETVTGLFVLTGDGEESGDLWRAYFRCGKFYKTEPTFPEFDEFKLS